jgi:hypothetical protein
MRNDGVAAAALSKAVLRDQLLQAVLRDQLLQFFATSSSIFELLKNMMIAVPNNK